MLRFMSCFLLAAAAACAGCVTSPTGRAQLHLFPQAEMAKMGVAAYDEMKSKQKVSTDATLQRRARCVTDAVAAQVTGPYAGTRWEVTVFEDPSPNAFALPGGKIGVHSGLFAVAQNQDQLATVLGHEVAHVLAEHANERISTQYATQSGIQILDTLSGGMSPGKQQLLGLLGAGVVVLPFSRAQESESDTIGLELMARAGFDPTQSVALWQNMAAAGGGQPPEFLSTHPAHGRRIADLQAALPSAKQLRAEARARGLRPRCY
ncbi:MAG: M48 family metallopeptidase [Deltaproteobacteria bacterium]|nr:M48 family metallopeptidase [Deltaproteobacteria bacterium]MBW2361562.1 M48 family metallopeptidase [Deltaproteobacteria bacterium]